MINLSDEFNQMIQELTDQSEAEYYKLRVLTTDSPVVFAGIDSGKLTRQIFLDLGIKSIDEKLVNSLPRWRGMTIRIQKYAKLFMLKDHYFLIFSQEDESGSDIFINVMQDMIETLTVKASKHDQTIYSSVYQVLDKWKNFFLRGGYRLLSDEEQRGLFGELWFINEWLDEFPHSPPLIIEQWDGPTKGRIDFRKASYGLEIKTVTDKLSKTIKISNENQLKLSAAISSIYLYVCYLEKSKTHGISLQDLTKEVRGKIAYRSERIAREFCDLLLSIGYKEEEYADTYYFVEKIEIYEASQNFPRILKEDLPKGISNVSYSIDLTHCTEFEREKEVIYQQFRLEG
ncbi:hypothetical protein UP17_20030 [Peribacillus simplex]|uniref:PD-(D/E)XK motif protein n=1 Tax=Peribacillus simplex TaxID=1478 RepID=UPI000776BC10|nr:PD-(D/E)XK motif protein [Peribacillus simplex]AMM94487.1 hypothetical protein UP17_20030 [Peribacillus simplex]